MFRALRHTAVVSMFIGLGFAIIGQEPAFFPLGTGISFIPVLVLASISEANQARKRRARRLQEQHEMMVQQTAMMARMSAAQDFARRNDDAL